MYKSESIVMYREIKKAANIATFQRALLHLTFYLNIQQYHNL